MPTLPRKDLTGQRFGLWTIISRGSTTGMWLAECQCGTRRDLQQAAVLYGRTLSCGCDRSRNTRTHGSSESSEMRSYYHMRERCLSPTCRDYAHYGGRGINICDRWLSDSRLFLSDMGPKPPGKTTIERRDVNGDYTPENCFWADRATQADNTRVTTRYTINGVTKTLHQWCRERNLYVQVVRNRVQKLNMTPEEALSIPTRWGYEGRSAPRDDYKVFRRVR